MLEAAGLSPSEIADWARSAPSDEGAFPAAAQAASSFFLRGEELLRRLPPRRGRNEAEAAAAAELNAALDRARSRFLRAHAADVYLDCRVSEEACPMNLVPTASTTAMLALGDALAMTVLVEKGFQPEDFASLHPGGNLGKKLMRVEQLMHSGDQIPLVQSMTAMREVIYEMSRKRLGMTCVVDGDRALLGIITDGDLRRKMMAAANVLDLTAGDVMTTGPVSISRSALAAQALNVLERRKITSIVVIDDQHRVEGVVHLHDLWKTGLV